jgi:GntR family transcriptional regulator
VRRYLDSSGGPMMTSVNWHPSDRFTYLMRLRRDAIE